MKKLIEEATTLNATYSTDVSFAKWQGAVNVLLSHAGPCSRHLYQRFCALQFGYVRNSRNLNEQLNNFPKAMEQAVRLLSNFKRQIEGWQYYLLWIRGTVATRFAIWRNSLPKELFWKIANPTLAAVFGALIFYIIMRVIDAPGYDKGTQNETDWHSLKPAIKIQPLQHSNLKTLETEGEETIGKGSYRLFFTLKNIGNTAAVLDSILTEVFWNNKLYPITQNQDGIMLFQQEELVNNMVVRLNKESGGHFHVRIYYSWNVEEKASESLITDKYYEAKYKDDYWHFYMIIPDSFPSVSSVPSVLGSPP